MDILSLCAGVGGLDLGIRLAVPSARTVCYVENEAFAIEDLVRQMEAGRLDEAPIWSDVRTFDGKPWGGAVDLVVAGYPCQPFSVAGRRTGTDDPRHLWPSVSRIVAEARPPLCFFENVPGHLAFGFSEVCDDLIGMGYSITAGLFSASEVGATHRRERLFFMAYTKYGIGSSRQGKRGVQHQPSSSRVQGFDSRPSEMGHGDNKRLQRYSGGHSEIRETLRSIPTWPPGPTDAGWPSIIERRPGLAPAVANPERSVVQVSPSGRAEGAGRGTLASASGEDVAFSSIKGGINSSRSATEQDKNWQEYGLSTSDSKHADEEAQPRLRGVADGLPSRVDRLRCLGNGVVPVVAAYAFVALWGKLVASYPPPQKNL